MQLTHELATDLPLPDPGGKVDLLIIAGEHSGDEHAAKIVEGLRREQPDLRIVALGGQHLAASGAQVLFDLPKVSVVGFFEVVKHLRFFRQLFRATLDWIATHQPAHICFVDYPGFNLRLAKALKARGLSRKGGGRIGLHYYVAPQVWAWKPKRRFAMAATLDRLGVIFPFETECFADTALPVAFVGHPFVGKDATNALAYDPSAPALLLPGSRRAAVGRIFPVLLEGFRLARQSEPSLRARVVYPTTALRVQLETIASDYPELLDAIEWMPNSTQRITGSRVLMSSGTYSLACALAAIPGAIVYRLHPISYWLGKWLVKVPFIGIANILLRRAIYPEYLQKDAQAEILARALSEAVKPERVVRARSDAAELREALRSETDTTAASWLLEGMKPH
jgi:lipid-A-disaccharide synthase